MTMSKSLTWVSSGHHSSTHHSSARTSQSHAGRQRLSSVLKSGILEKRGKILDEIDNCIQSRTALPAIDVEGREMLDLFNLTYLNAFLFATILEDALTELKILGECNNWLKIMRTEGDRALLTSAKFGIEEVSMPDPAGVDPREVGKEEYKLKKVIDPSEIGKEEFKLKKLAADRQYFKETLKVTYLDLTLNYSFESLAQQMAGFYARDAHIARLTEEEAQNRITRRELARQLRLQRNHMLSANYDVDVAIDSLFAQLEDAGLYAESRSRFVTSWERARTEQHDASILEAEAQPMSSMLRYKQSLDSEHRIHSELMLLIKARINDSIDKVEAMMNKYDTDMEAIDLQIQIMKNKHQNQFDIRRDLDAKYKAHKEQVQAWLAFKQNREDARLHREKMTHAAIVAQAWWRGMLVRLQLGPYKPTKRTPWRPKKK